MIGRWVDGVLLVDKLVPCRNLSSHPGVFIIGHHDFQEVAHATALPTQVVGIYHSHPASARPSEADKRSIRLQNLAWLIIGNTQSRSREALEFLAYRRRSRRAIEAMRILWH
jgi:proteasome lid subunit RPN8/RPN11